LLLVLAADLVAYAVSVGVGIPLSSYLNLKRAPYQLSFRDDASRDARLDRRMAFPFLAGIDWASVNGIPVLQGYGSLSSGRYSRMIGQRAGSRDAEVGGIIDSSLAEPSSHVLDLMRCRVVVSYASKPGVLQAFADRVLAGDPRWELVAGPSANGGRTYVNHRALPVAWLVHRVRIVSDEEALQLVRGTSPDQSFDPAREALLTTASPGLALVDAAPSADDSVDLTSYDEDELRIHATTRLGGLLVTSELAEAGWEATVDGASTEILTANYAFRSIPVPPGVVLPRRQATRLSC
jgi:hypothetical protein